MWLDEEAKMGLISSVYYKFFVLRGSTMSDIISTLLGGEQSWTSTFNLQPSIDTTGMVRIALMFNIVGTFI